jgi:hypothetical protein
MRQIAGIYMSEGIAVESTILAFPPVSIAAQQRILVGCKPQRGGGRDLSRFIVTGNTADISPTPSTHVELSGFSSP